MKLISKEQKIYIAGHNGMVGSAIKRKLLSEDYNNLLVASKKDLDLRDANKVENFFK